ncbi:class I SAM-dependent methyltransferase, partial [Fulvivirga sp. RKSG066]|uniref:class I SAM-dependent methyltransferase n=1 Tax=Fulvivirga aurantia TaxID=2529383 RepID=UPI0012BCC7E2
MIKEIASKEVQDFITANEDVDPFELSLKHRELFGLPIKIISEQIAARKKAKTKLPEWYATDGIVYPPLLSMEQCSSEQAAQYKSTLLSGHTLLDLTGGTGVDTHYLSKNFKHCIYVERNKHLCEIARHNFTVFQNDKIQVFKDKSEDFINTYSKNVDAIFIDPARRDDDKNKVFRWEDCEPNVVEIQEDLFELADDILIKGSPMLDINSSLAALNHVKAVHVLSIKNECKEVLYHLQKNNSSTVKVQTINITASGDQQVFDFLPKEEENHIVELSEPQAFLYEPNASILKAGAFKSVSVKYKLNKLHQHTHLYTSKSLITGFPG